MFELTSEENPIIELPFGMKGKVFRGTMPYSLFDPQGKVLDAAARAGVDVVVLLAEDEECLLQTDRDLGALYETRGWVVLRAPVADQGVPALEARALFRERLLETRALADEGHHVLVHCLAGLGRTGMFLACLARLVRAMGPDAAIAWVRHHVPNAIEKPEQVRFVETFVL